MEGYRPRVADSELAEWMTTMGAVLIELAVVTGPVSLADAQMVSP